MFHVKHLWIKKIIMHFRLSNSNQNSTRNILFFFDIAKQKCRIHFPSLVAMKNPRTIYFSLFLLIPSKQKADYRDWRKISSGENNFKFKRSESLRNCTVWALASLQFQIHKLRICLFSLARYLSQFGFLLIIVKYSSSLSRSNQNPTNTTIFSFFL